MYEPRKDLATSPETIWPNHDAPVPAARPLEAFGFERVGDNVVLFDSEANRYHTTNAVAFDIWRRCNGTESIANLAKTLDMQPEVVVAAVEQLGEAGLLMAPESQFESTLHRRRVMKLAAVGLLGALALPVVQSISVPDTVSAATGVTCPDGRKCPASKCCCCHPTGQGGGFDNCDCSCSVQGQDCSTPGLSKVCVC